MSSTFVAAVIVLIIISVVIIYNIILIIHALLLIAFEYYYISVPIFSLIFGKKIISTLWPYIDFISNKISTRIQKKIPSEKRPRINQFNSDFQSLSHDLFLSKYNAKKIDESKRGNTLYQINGVIPYKKLKLLRYTDPSTQKLYLCFVPEKFKSADKSMGWKFYLSEQEYNCIQGEA